MVRWRPVDINLGRAQSRSVEMVGRGGLYSPAEARLAHGGVETIRGGVGAIQVGRLPALRWGAGGSARRGEGCLVGADELRHARRSNDAPGVRVAIIQRREQSRLRSLEREQVRRGKTEGHLALPPPSRAA